jgi:Protein of unknown function (DUF3300)
MISAALFAIFLSAGGPQEMVIPEGTILPVILNETINTAKVQDDDPILLSLAEDVRSSGRRGQILIPRGSSVVGRIAKADRAGHFIGRSNLDIRVQEIITPSGEAYDGLSTRIIDIAKKKGVKGEVRRDGVIEGPVHRGRDAFLLLFPPTTIFQLMATPKRGPDVVLPVETRLYVKLMSPIYVEIQPNATAALSVTPEPVPAPRQLSRAFPALPAAILDVLVAPIALYPDAILRELLAAILHPNEILAASQWAQSRRDSSGSLPRSGYSDRWDESVKAMTAYPDLLQRLTADMNWTTKLGSAYASQPSEVMSAVQRMRAQAGSFRPASTRLALQQGF